MSEALSIALASLFVVASRSIVLVNYVFFARIWLQIEKIPFHVQYDRTEVAFTIISIASLSAALYDYYRTVSAWVAFVSLLAATTYLLFRLTGTTGKKDN